MWTRPNSVLGHRKPVHRLAEFARAVAFLFTAKLINWRNRWSPECAYPLRPHKWG